MLSFLKKRKSYTDECLDRAEAALADAYTERFNLQIAVSVAHGVLTQSELSLEDRVYKAIDILAPLALACANSH